MNEFLKNLRYIYNKQGSIGKTWQLFRREFNQNGMQGVKIIWKKSECEHYFKQWKNQPDQTVTIVATPHTIFISELISQALNQISIKNSIKIGNDFNEYDHSLHIVVCPRPFKHLPKTYIAFQMEQTVSDRWFGPEQMNKLKQSLLVMDYSLNNIEFLGQHLPLSQLYYSPISPIELNTSEPLENFEYDVLFYGDTNNERRQQYLQELQKKFRVKIINNAFGKEIWQEIKKARIVINIHYYEGALLETTRLYECLSNNALVISEKSADFDQHDDLINLVDFVEIGDIDQMIQRVEYWINNSESYTDQKNKISAYIQQDQNVFNFYFYRILLSLGLIDFKLMYGMTSKIWQPDSQFWCLGLPESTLRQKEFTIEKQKYSKNIWHFPGIRHSTPWIGCGLSYKYMLQYAKDHQWKQITICEDDVLFPEHLNKSLEQIEKFLINQEIEWDIFSGHITDLDDHARIKPLHKTADCDFIALNKTTGMVFNIYNDKFFSYLTQWDENDENLSINAIDRYIERKADLSVITTLPYLVGHKEDVETTLWDRKHCKFSYQDMTEKSQQALINKLDQ